MPNNSKDLWSIQNEYSRSNLLFNIHFGFDIDFRGGEKEKGGQKKITTTTTNKNSIASHICNLRVSGDATEYLSVDQV